MNHLGEDVRRSALHDIIHVDLPAFTHRDAPLISFEPQRRVVDARPFALYLKTVCAQLRTRNPRLVHLRVRKAGPGIVALPFISLASSIDQKSIVFDRHWNPRIPADARDIWD